MTNRFPKALAAALMTLASAVALADNPQLAGSYVYVPERSDKIEAAIDTTVASANFIIRPIARSRLKKTNIPPYQKVSIEFPPGKVSIVTDKRAPIVTTGDSKSVRWKREDGELLDVSTEWQGKELEESFSSDDGKRTNHFTLSGDGKELKMHVVVTSPKLAKPLSYTLVYERR